MADWGDVERMVDDLERDAVEKSRRYQAMQAQVEQISITESVAGGAVSVTVGHNGLPTDIKMTDGVRRMNPDEIAANVMRALQKAQSKYTGADAGDRRGNRRRRQHHPPHRGARGRELPAATGRSTRGGHPGMTTTGTSAASRSCGATDTDDVGA